MAKAKKEKKDGTEKTQASGVWWKVMLIFVVGFGLAGGLWFRMQNQLPPGMTLPDLPDLSGQPQALVTHLQKADQFARNNMSSADAIGALGLAYHSDGFYSEAGRCYNMATTLEPDGWRWWYYTALLMEELGYSDAEFRALEQVVALKPDLTLAWYRMGETATKLGQFDKAQDAYTRAIEEARKQPYRWANSLIPQSRTFPIAAYASLGLGRIAQEQGRLQEAQDVLEKLTDTYPRFGPAHRLLGRVYHDSGEDRAGMERTARATFYPPYYPPADSLVDALARASCSSSFLLKQMGVAKMSQNGQWAEYLAKRALSVNPDDPGAIAGLGLLLLKMGRADDALPYVKKYAQIAGDDQGTLVTMGYDLANLGRFEEAVHYVRQALEIDDQSADAHNVMSYALGGLGKFDEAIAHAKKALEMKPDDPQAHDHIATFLARQGKRDDALAFLRKAVTQRPNSAEAHNNLGIYLSGSGGLEEAQKHLETAIELRPDFAKAHSNLGVILARQGKLDEGRAHLETALRIQPDNAETHNNLSGILIEQGAFAKARQHLETALRIRPNYMSAKQNLARLMRRPSR